MSWDVVCFGVNFDTEVCSSKSSALQAWEEDPVDTLKLIAHLRDVRDGKADQDLFHDCIAWLWQEHPLTLLANLEEIVKVAHAGTTACTSTHTSVPYFYCPCRGP